MPLLPLLWRLENVPMMLWKIWAGQRDRNVVRSVIMHINDIHQLPQQRYGIMAPNANIIALVRLKIVITWDIRSLCSSRSSRSSNLNLNLRNKNHNPLQRRNKAAPNGSNSPRMIVLNYVRKFVCIGKRAFRVILLWVRILVGEGLKDIRSLFVSY